MPKDTCPARKPYKYRQLDARARDLDHKIILALTALEYMGTTCLVPTLRPPQQASEVPTYAGYERTFS